MKLRSAKARFVKRLDESGLSLDTLTAVVGTEAMLAYYAEERADGCPIDEDGDMLLFQWGTYDWGSGPAFEVSIVRQLIASRDPDQEPRQLDLRFRYEPASGVSAGRANRWCESPEDLPQFRRFLTESPALQAVGHLRPVAVELRYGRT